MKQTLLRTFLLVVLMHTGFVFATDQDDGFSFGGSVCARYELMDNMPRGVLENDSSDFARLRTRIYGRYRRNDWNVYLRLGNEFRWYRTPKSRRERQSFPDILFIDNLYVEKKNLLMGLM